MRASGRAQHAFVSARCALDTNCADAAHLLRGNAHDEATQVLQCGGSKAFHLIEELMIERMGENDKIVTRYMADQEFQGSAFPILAREIFEAVRATGGEAAGNTEKTANRDTPQTM